MSIARRREVPTHTTERDEVGRAATAICQAIYGPGRCNCEFSETKPVCATMLYAAQEAQRILAPAKQR